MADFNSPPGSPLGSPLGSPPESPPEYDDGEAQPAPGLTPEISIEALFAEAIQRAAAVEAKHTPAAESTPQAPLPPAGSSESAALDTLFSSTDRPNVAAAELIALFHALGHRTRLEIVALLLENDESAGDIACALELSTSTTAHHLSALRQAGVIRLEQVGSFHMYTLEVGLSNLLEQAAAWAQASRWDAS